jgi:predicted  nucleic acid-binding Zn-ribbon protein
MAIGLILGWQALSSPVFAQDAKTETLRESELLLSPSADQGETSGSTGVLSTIERTPSFEELDSAASDLNEALSGARAKLDELRQATELAAMAAELREELETSIQENNRLAASLAEVQSERSELESQNIEAQRQIVELTETVESSELELASQADRLERRQDEIEQITGARNDAENQVRELELQLGRTDDEVDQLRDEIVELTGLLEATRTELNDANDRADEARLARDSADQELSKVRKQIAGMLRSVLLGGEPIDVSNLEDENGSIGGENLDLGVRYEAIRASNVRAEPDPDSERVGFAKRGDFVTVLNKVSGRNWFEIETAEGVRGFIFGDLIRPDA